ncbi:MAG: peptidase T [Acidobacteriota bacterium]|nr:peptidase T [Acidobacteriota bacterium]
MTTTALERFLRYVRIDTRADDSSTACPSTPGQLEMMRLIVAELRQLGLDDVVLDDYGYVMATVPASSPKVGVPVIGFIAHVDTSPEMSGAGVRPIVHRNYDGGDIVLPDDPLMVLRSADIPALAARIGDDIVTASGTTLLGADDKAGVAEIMAAVDYLLRHPEIPHGAIRIGFTPDEEIGRGADHFDVARFGAVCAYTLDGGSRGELEHASFSADLFTVVVKGFNTHPGYAKGKMVNAIRVAADFIASLPRTEMTPETTDGDDGFVHPYDVQAGVDQTTVKVLIRDFMTGELGTKRALLEYLARDAGRRHPGCTVETTVTEQYRNMREVLERHPQVLAHARTAMRRVGIEPVERPIRGGTDGSRLSFMGLPTPNLFAGEHNFHSRVEWVSSQDMDKAVEVVVQLCQVWWELPA